MESILSPHIDEDTIEYIASLIEDSENDDDLRETVYELLLGNVDDDEVLAARLLKEILPIEQANSKNGDTQESGDGSSAPMVRKLEKSLKIQDDTEESGPTDEFGLSRALAGGPKASASMDIQDFYANMIDIRSEEISSQRAKRKEAQKKLREKQQEEDRQRAIRDAMEMAMAAQEEEEDMKDSTDFSDNYVDVHLQNIDLPNKRGSGEDLLVSSNLTLAKGRRYGLLGRNGCGKTTLMELVAQRGIPGIPKKMSMLLVRQEIVGNDLTPVEFLLRSDARREGLKRYIEMCESGNSEFDDDKLNQAYMMLEEMDEQPPEPRARKILFGMGFTEDMQERPTKELSGGWRMRVSLCSALFAEPSLLLLDEPTNHLDLEAVLWLEQYLTKKFQGTVLLVSHDRHFLNEVVTDVVHFNNRRLKTYRGDISNFDAVREEEKQRQIRLRENQEAKRDHLQKYIDLHAQAGENGVKAAKQRKSRMKKLEKLGTMAQEGKKYKASYDGPVEEVEEFKEDEKVILDFPDPGGFNENIVTLERMQFGYTTEKTLLAGVDLTVDSSSRIAFLGRNGCGKSTLIKLIVGSLNPQKGKAVVNGRAKIEYLAQHQLEQLDPNANSMDTILERYPSDMSNSHKMDMRRYLANFGLGGEVLPYQQVKTMSGGQKCRLCLACALYRKPHLLVLDEPTNHLDLETTEALIEAIRNFAGGVLLVSHDQHLITSVCRDLYVVQDGSLERLSQGMVDGSAFQAYKKAVVQGRR